MRLARDEQAKNILDAFAARSEEIKDPAVVEAKYKAFAAEMREMYLVALSAVNADGLIFRIINKLSGYKFATWVINRKYNKAKLLRIQNYIECEAHRELFLKSLNSD